MPTPPTLSSAVPTSPSPPACTLTLNPGVRRIAFATTVGTDLREPALSAPTEHSSIRPCSGASSGTQLTAAQPSPSTAGFVCPNGTLFDQTLFRCEFWHTVDCSAAVSLYSLNADPLLNPYLPKPILDEYGNVVPPPVLAHADPHHAVVHHAAPHHAVAHHAAAHHAAPVHHAAPHHAVAHHAVAHHAAPVHHAVAHHAAPLHHATPIHPVAIPHHP